MKAKFEHDCLACRYLGTVEGPNPYHEGRAYTWDLYFCARSDGGTVIARYASEGSKYQSTPVSMLKSGGHPALLWAVALLEMEERKEKVS